MHDSADYDADTDANGYNEIDNKVIAEKSDDNNNDNVGNDYRGDGNTEIVGGDDGDDGGDLGGDLGGDDGGDDGDRFKFIPQRMRRS